MRKKVVLFTSLICFAAICVKAQAPENLSDFVLAYQTQDPKYLKFKQDEMLLRYFLDRELNLSPLQVSVAAERGLSSQSNQDTSNLTGEIEKNILDSGTALSLSYSRTQRPDREENVTQFRLVQSLLNNGFGKSTRLQRDNLQIEEQIRGLTLLEAYEDYLGQRINDFIELNSAHDLAKTAEKVYQETQKFYQDVKAKRSFYVARASELNQAELLLLNREAEWIRSKLRFETLEEQVAAALKNQSFVFSPSNLNELLLYFSKKRDLALNVKDKNLREIEIATLSKQLSKQSLKLVKQQNQPNLNAIFGLNRDDSIRFSTPIERTESVFGVFFEMPIGSRQIKADKEVAKINVKQSELDEEVTRLGVEQEALRIQNRLQEAERLTKLNKRRLGLLEKTIDEQGRRFRRGQTNIQDLIDLRNQYSQILSESNQNQLEYAQRLVSWLNVNDFLLKD